MCGQFLLCLSAVSNALFCCSVFLFAFCFFYFVFILLCIILFVSSSRSSTIGACALCVVMRIPLGIAIIIHLSSLILHTHSVRRTFKFSCGTFVAKFVLSRIADCESPTGKRVNIDLFELSGFKFEFIHPPGDYNFAVRFYPTRILMWPLPGSKIKWIFVVIQNGRVYLVVCFIGLGHVYCTWTRQNAELQSFGGRPLSSEPKSMLMGFLRLIRELPMFVLENKIKLCPTCIYWNGSRRGNWHRYRMI